jgi:hypothetical protein
LLAAAIHHGCTPAGRIHSDAPVSWSTSSSESPTSRSETVCEGGQPRPCVLNRTTEARPSYATFVLHVWGPSPTKFTGSVFVGYLLDPDPRHYKSDVELTSNGQDVHHRIFSRVTDEPGQYTVRIQLEESGSHLTTPRTHDLTVPVTVK